MEGKKVGMVMAVLVAMMFTGCVAEWTRKMEGKKVGMVMAVLVAMMFTGCVAEWTRKNGRIEEVLSDGGNHEDAAEEMLLVSVVDDNMMRKMMMKKGHVLACVPQFCNAALPCETGCTCLGIPGVAGICA